MDPKSMITIIGSVGVMVVFALICLHARKRLRELSEDPPLYVKTTKPNRTFPKPWIMAGNLIAKSNEVPPDDPPLRIGDECIFISFTGPVMTVVDANDTTVIAAWDDGMQEHNFSRRVVRRWKPDETVRPRKVSA